MSLTHCIRTLIDLKDKNISFPENYCEERVIKGRRTKLIYATLTYKPVCCTRCGCLNTQFTIVKNGFLTSVSKDTTDVNSSYSIIKKIEFNSNGLAFTTYEDGNQTKIGYEFDSENANDEKYGILKLNFTDMDVTSTDVTKVKNKENQIKLDIGYTAVFEREN